MGSCAVLVHTGVMTPTALVLRTYSSSLDINNIVLNCNTIALTKVCEGNSDSRLNWLVIYKDSLVTMSLFGPDEASPVATSKTRNTLFDDEDSLGPASKSSLFADDDGPGSSPWDMPTPKKAARGDLIKNLLPASSVPESYITTFDTVLSSIGGSGGKISADGIAKVVDAANLNAEAKDRVKNVMNHGGQLDKIGRNEFNVLLALIGLAQENEEITLDGVDERRKSE